MSSVDRTLDILEVLAREGAPLSLKEVTERTGLTRPTTHRLLQLLLQRGYVEQDAKRAYLVGPHALGLAGRMLAQLEPTRAAQPALEQMRRLTPETIHFAVLAGSDAVYVEKIDGRRAYRMASQIGQHLALHCTSIGKAILAFLSEDRRAQLLDGRELDRRTPNTITKREALEQELEAIRELGYAIDDEENEHEIRCVGAAVFDPRGAAFGGISISAPAFHFSNDEARLAAPAVIDAARAISLAVGAPLEVLPSGPRVAEPVLLGGNG